MRLDTPNMKQGSYDRERTLEQQHQRATTAGILVVLAAVIASLLIWYFAYQPTGAPNSGSTSTSAVVDPGDTVGPNATPKPNASGVGGPGGRPE